MANIKQVAARAGVSVATVSRVINNHGYISQEMRDKIQLAMEELNYHPNEVARSLTQKRTKMIGVLVPRVSTIFFSEVVEELSRTITSRGYKMILYNAMWSDDQALEYVSMLKGAQVDGMIISLRGHSIDAVLPDNLPVVALARNPIGNHPVVHCDNEMGGRLAAQELLRCGCKKPLFLGLFHNRDVPAYRRREGFFREMEQADIHPREIETFGLDLASKYELVAEAALQQYPDTDGIFCVQDRLAAEVLNKLYSTGKRVPQDMKVIGFDGGYVTKYLCPSLTSIRQPVPQMCQAAVDILIRRIEGEPYEKEVVLPVTLMRQCSTEMD